MRRCLSDLQKYFQHNTGGCKILLRELQRRSGSETQGGEKKIKNSIILHGSLRETADCF